MSIFIFLVVLVVLILVHEFGHFIAAKKSGIRVDEFGIGFPPRALRLWKKGETEYTLNWLPFGGFVKIFGENPDEESQIGPDSSRSLIHKPKWIQAMVLFAGVFFNVLFAWFLFAIVFSLGSPTAISEEDITDARDIRLIIAEVLPSSPAEAVGLRAGDQILSISRDETLVKNLLPSEVSRFIEEAGDGGELLLSLRRGVEEIQITAMPELGFLSLEPERPVLGISMGLVGLVSYPIPSAIWESLKFTIQMTGLIIVSLLAFFVSAITFSADLSQIAGPVGIVGLVGEASTLGFVFLLNFTAFISINLAVINLLPFPALDGGRLSFLLIESIKGSPIKPEAANIANMIGFGLLILLMLIVTYSDITRIISG